MRLRYGVSEEQEDLQSNIKLITARRQIKIEGECRRAGIDTMYIDSPTLRFDDVGKVTYGTHHELILLGRFGALASLKNSEILFPQNSAKSNIETVSGIAKESDAVINALIDLSRQYNDVESIKEIEKMIVNISKFTQRFKFFLYNRIKNEEKIER